MKNTIAVIVFCLFALLVRSQEIKFDKVEPPFWYDGYKTKTLMLMVYGKNLSTADFSLNAPDVKLVKVITLDHPDYVLLNIEFTGASIPPFFPVTVSSGKTTVTEFLYEIRPGPAPRQQLASAAEQIIFTPSVVNYFEPEPKYQKDKGVFLADTAHSHGKELILKTGTSVGSGHPWIVRPPVADWVVENKTSRNTVAWLTSKPMVDLYLIQNTMWWVEQIHPDKICIPGIKETDKAFYQKLKPVMESEYPGLPVINDCNTR